MIWRIVRSRGFIPVVLILAALLSRIPARLKSFRSGTWATATSSSGTRSPRCANPSAKILHYGDRVEVGPGRGVSGSSARALGNDGMDARFAANYRSELWGKSASLLEGARTLPIQEREAGRKPSAMCASNRAAMASAYFKLARGTRVLIC